MARVDKGAQAKGDWQAVQVHSRSLSHMDAALHKVVHHHTCIRMDVPVRGCLNDLFCHQDVFGGVWGEAYLAGNAAKYCMAEEGLNARAAMRANLRQPRQGNQRCQADHTCILALQHSSFLPWLDTILSQHYTVTSCCSATAVSKTTRAHCMNSVTPPSSRLLVCAISMLCPRSADISLMTFTKH